MAKRIIVFLILIVLVVPILSACGGDTSTATPVPAATATVGVAATVDTTGSTGATATTDTSGTAATATTGGSTTDATATTGTSATTGTTGGTVGAPATTNVLVVSPNGNQSTTFVSNFNPFTSAQLFPTINGIYEPLMIFNEVNGQIVPWLADSYKWSTDNKTLTFALHPGVKWSDGQAFTSADVVYTFNLLKNTPGLQGNGTLAVGTGGYVDSVTAPDANTVAFNFNKVYTPGLNDLINQVIVPQHIWQNIADPAKSTNDNPVGTGPFTQVTNFQAQAYQVDKNPNYWQPGKPYINGLRMPALGGNDQAAVAFANGTLDWGGFSVANLQQSVISKDPTNLHFWFTQYGGTAIFMMNTTQKIFQDPVLRKAISLSLNRPQMIALGENGYTVPADITGLSAGYSTWKPAAADMAKMGDWVTYDPARANQMLDAAGYKKGADGIRTTPDGTKLSFEFTMVNGFSDWIAIGPTLVQNLKAIGLDPQQKNYDFPVALGNWQNGKFDTSLYFGFSANTPFNVYRDIMSKSTLMPVGQSSGFLNPFRYSSEKADALLDQFATSSDPAKQKEIAIQLEQVFADEAPVVPLWAQPGFYEYSTKNFTDWPSADNPYTAGTATISNAEPAQLIMFTTIKPK